MTSSWWRNCIIIIIKSFRWCNLQNLGNSMSWTNFISFTAHIISWYWCITLPIALVLFMTYVEYAFSWALDEGAPINYDSNWRPQLLWYNLSHWDRVTHICVSKLTTIGAYYGLWTGWHQSFIQCENIVNSKLRNKLQGNINRNSYIFTQYNYLKMSSAKCRPFYIGLDELINDYSTLGLI